MFWRRNKTLGDAVRKQLRKHGVPDPRDFLAEVMRRLQLLPPAKRSAFALACAERLMEGHFALPAEAQRAFTVGWRPVLEAMWRGLEGQPEDAADIVRGALGAFHASPYWHDDGQDGPNDADEAAAAASIYAAECFVSGDAKSAYWAAARAVDRAEEVAGQDFPRDAKHFVREPNSDHRQWVRQLRQSEVERLTRLAMHAAMQAELQRQAADLTLLEAADLSRDTLDRLRCP